MKYFYNLFFAFILCGSFGWAQKNRPQNPVFYFEKKPSWVDEFNTNNFLDTSKWSYEIGGTGFGNHELEYYTNAKNAFVKNGKLVLSAKKENFGGMNYTSAKLVTKDKANFMYGRLEIRAKLSTGKGLWPAIWMMPAEENYGSWPNSGEIDIMEQVGFEPDSIHISTHTKEENWMKKNGHTKVKFVKEASSKFHVYRIDWTPAAILGFIDGEKLFVHKNEAKGNGYWPFDKPFYLILNIAIGGDWGGIKGVDNTIFPKTMEIDYVRYYKMKERKF